MSPRFFSFGTLSDGTEVTAGRLENTAGASLTVLDYGATIQSICVPDREGNLTDVVLGYETAAEYEKNGGYLGATIGRVCNRIGGASFSINGSHYDLVKNDGENHLHGGLKGFDKKMWDMTAGEDCIICKRLSPDGEESYPGNLLVQVTFRLTEDNAVHIIYDAQTDADTPVNLTNHSYFNLDGSENILQHHLQVFADRFCEGDAGCLPTGKLCSVEGTPFDFRKEKKIGADITCDDEQLKLANGYDHNYCLSGNHAARLGSDKSGIEMTVETDRPGMQVYTANLTENLIGKVGRHLGHHCGVCLETQLFPNALACPDFPSPILKKDQKFHTETVYTFTN